MIQQMLEAADAALKNGDEVKGARLKLKVVDILGSQGETEAARTMLDSCLAVAKRCGALEAEWRIALATTGKGDRIGLLETALTHLPTESEIRLTVHRRLSLIYLNGGDRVAGRAHLEHGLKMAQTAQDVEAITTFSDLLGHHLLKIGLANQARPHLQTVLTLTADQPLIQIRISTVLAALYLRNQAWEEARILGKNISRMCEARNNWIGFADGLLTQTTAIQHSGSLLDAIRLLLSGGRILRISGSEAGLNLIKARLTELRVQIGPETFDLMLTQLINEP